MFDRPGGGTFPESSQPNTNRAMLTPHELLAVLPDLDDPPPGLRSLRPAAPPALVAEARSLREATAPTASSLLRAAQRSSRLLGALGTFFAPAFGRLGIWLNATFLVASPAVVAACALYPALAGTAAPFGTLNIALGTAAVAAVDVGAVSYFSAPMLRRWSLFPDASKHKLHALLRYQDLTGPHFGEGGLELGRSVVFPLVQHVPGDPNCPCKSAACAGGLAFWEGIFAAADLVLRAASVFCYQFVLAPWTPMVSLAPVFWRGTWYGPILGMLIVALGLVHAYSICAYVYRRAKPPLMQLSRRLQCRAVDLLLGELLTDCKDLIEASGLRDGKSHGPVLADVVPDGNSEAHTRNDMLKAVPNDLNDQFLFAFLRYLANSWTVPLREQLSAALRTSSFILFFLPGFAANLAVGSCVPAWELSFLAWWILYTFSFLFDLAAANARIDAVRGVVRAGSAEALALLSLSSPPGGAVPDPGLSARLSALSRRLDAFAASVEPARFAGIQVTYGSARALVVSLCTVLFALWGLLNGLGVRVVLETYCPGRA
ncbi:hypothetical protein DFJ74DRAFT_740099 [Hyaloraphidium curvatum]|nr:hypothetical protein DFJ74DRAFT_740099 [Hyaloraphidium curvatum]